MGSLEVSQGILEGLGVRVLRLDAEVVPHPLAGVAPLLALLLQSSIRDGLQLHLGMLANWNA